MEVLSQCMCGECGKAAPTLIRFARRTQVCPACLDKGGELLRDAARALQARTEAPRKQPSCEGPVPHRKHSEKGSK